MRELQARAQWFLLVTNRIEHPKQVTWCDSVSTPHHVEGTFTNRGRCYDIIADLVDGDLTPYIQKHDKPETKIDYAWGN